MKHLFPSLFFLPLAVVIYKQSTLYDSWRHLFFIYPAFVYTAVTGLQKLIRGGKNRLSAQNYWWFSRLLITAIVVNLLYAFIFMIQFHPHQHTYFNLAAGKGLTKRYDMDYWGNSYKAALEELVRRDGRACISVMAANYPGQANTRMLTPEYACHIQLAWHLRHAHYYITNYRYKEELEKYKNNVPPFDQPFFTIEVGEATVIGVYKVQ